MIKQQYLRNQHLSRIIRVGSKSQKKLESLLQKVEDGKAARETMILENRPLAYSMAAKWSVADASQIALEALIISVDSYDPNKMRSFAHYASYKISGALTKAHETTLVKIGDNNARHLAHKNQANSSIDCYDSTKSHLLLAAVKPPLEIDAALDMTDSSLPADEILIAAESQKLMANEIDAAIVELDPIEQVMIQARYLSDPPVTYRVISQKYFLAIGSLKETETRAMEKLKDILG